MATTDTTFSIYFRKFFNRHDIKLIGKYIYFLREVASNISANNYYTNSVEYLMVWSMNLPSTVIGLMFVAMGMYMSK